MIRRIAVPNVAVAGLVASMTLSATLAQERTEKGRKEIVLIAGRPSHGYGAHEHNAGCLLLAKCLNEGLPNVHAVVHRNGWPKDPKAFDNVAAVVIFCDGGGGHVILPHLAEVDRLMKKGVGLACLHYAVQVPKGQPGNYFLDWIGGYYELWWSINPHWAATFDTLPDHPITRGVKPFTIDDEWYYHMRFRKDMAGVTPILTAVPPDSTRKRPDGPHSGNKYVRARMGQPEHVAWAYQRADGGRGFGFTGGHWHRNWGHDDFRKLVLNAIAWVAHLDVPPDGVPSKTPTVEELEANQDFPKPRGYNPQQIRKRLQEWNRSPAGRAPSPKAPAKGRLAVASVKVLSKRGSTRSTRYVITNKIVTRDGKTHVAWLDSISQTMVATYDHGSGTWSDPVKVGDGTDNHGGPALTCDSQGVLHIIFGPHCGPFQHCQSARPNDASKWVKLPDFGDQATYPSVVCDDKDTLHVICRGRPEPRMLLYQRRPKGGTWSKPIALARAPITSGYTHYHSGLTIARDQSLHVAYDIYYKNAAKCAGHMMSADRGTTWTLADGRKLELPVTPKADAFFRRTDTALKTDGVVCDSKSRPWVCVSTSEIWHYDGAAWRHVKPHERLSPRIAVNKVGGAGSLCLDAKDRLYVPVVIDGYVVMMVSDDMGKTFTLLRVFPPDEKLPHTGLNIERPTGHHGIDLPWLLFATGLKGPDCYGRGIYQTVRAVRFAR